MDEPAPPPGFAVDTAPPAGFTVDAPAAQAAPDQPAAEPPAGDQQQAPGFTDEQRQKILDYLPQAKDPADLEQFASELTQGRANIGNAKDVLDKYAQGHRQFAWSAPTPAKAASKPEPTHEDIKGAIGDGILESLDTFFPGVKQLLRSNEGSVRAGIDHVANSVAMDYGPEVGGAIDTIIHPGSDYERNVAHERAILEGDSEGHPIASTIGELAGTGADAALGNEAGLANLGRGARAATTAAEGAVYGSGAGGPDNRVGGAVTGAALGAATEGLAAGIAARRTAKTVADTANSEFADAAGRQGVDYMAADLPNATKSKFATALSALTLGGIPLADRGATNVGTAAAAADRVAGNVGMVADKTGAGQAAQRGARQFMDTTQAKMGALYDAIPIHGAAPAVVTNARSALNDLAQTFSSNPKLAAAFRDPKISAYLDALTPQTTKEATGLLDASGQPIMRDVTHGGGLSWSDLKDFRTRVGQIIGQPGLTTDGAQMGQLRKLYGALSDDMRATAQGAGPQAASAFERANTYARARTDRIDNVVSMILGKNDDKGPQSAFEAMQRLANDRGGDPIKLARALRSMPDDEANSVRATMLDGLGDASPGQQNGTGNVFSPAQWVTNWNKIGDRAKNVLFTGEHRKALDDLATLFSGMKSSTKFANTSKTGIGVVASTHTVPTMIANPVLGVLDVALQYGGGKLLASPAFARKVASTPKSIAGAKAFWSRPWVQAMAKKEPALAGEIQAFQHAFLTHANDNTASSLAAQPEEQNQDQQAAGG